METVFQWKAGVPQMSQESCCETLVPPESGATDDEIASTIRMSSIVRLFRFLTAISKVPLLLRGHNSTPALLPWA